MDYKNEPYEPQARAPRFARFVEADVEDKLELAVMVVRVRCATAPATQKGGTNPPVAARIVPSVRTSVTFGKNRPNVHVIRRVTAILLQTRANRDRSGASHA